MNGSTPVTVEYPLPGGGMAIYNSSAALTYAHADWLGSGRLVTNSSQQMVNDSAYAPFGEQWAVKNIGFSGFYSFTGQQQWTVSGSNAALDDFLFREYHPVQGRWITPDPAGLAAVDLTNPQTWNRYAYVGNNPLSFIDPFGLRPTACWESGGRVRCPAGGYGDAGALLAWGAGALDPTLYWYDGWHCCQGGGIGLFSTGGTYGTLPTNILNGLWNAWKALRKKPLSTNCVQRVLRPLGISVQQFQNFLAQNPSFYNGPTSTVPAYGNIVQRGFWNWLTTSGSTTVNQTFAPGTDAETLPGAKSLTTFVSPNAVDMSNFGANAPNEAMLFHEVLHGVSGIASDQTLQINLLGPSGVDMNSTINITDFIQDQCIQ